MISGSTVMKPGCCPAADEFEQMQADIDSMTDIEAAAELQKLAEQIAYHNARITVMMIRKSVMLPLMRLSAAMMPLRLHSPILSGLTALR